MWSLTPDGGWTRLLTYAQSTLDIAVGDYGLNTLKIPGTNGTGLNYVGIPGFYLTTFTGLATPRARIPLNSATINSRRREPELAAWSSRRQSGYTYYHFDLNHFQPPAAASQYTAWRLHLPGGMTCGNTPRLAPLPAVSTGITRLQTFSSACPTTAPTRR